MGSYFNISSVEKSFGEPLSYQSRDKEAFIKFSDSNLKPEICLLWTE